MMSTSANETIGAGWPSAGDAIGGPVDLSTWTIAIGPKASAKASAQPVAPIGGPVARTSRAVYSIGGIVLALASASCAILGPMADLSRRVTPRPPAAKTAAQTGAKTAVQSCDRLQHIRMGLCNPCAGRLPDMPTQGGER